MGGASEGGVRVPAGGRRLVLLALFNATFLVSLDFSIITTAMPVVVGQLGGIDLYAWVFSAYLLTSTVTMPIYGRLADLYGRKPTFLASTTIFLVGSLLCAQAQTMPQLIAFRLLQGLGAGGMLPITQTVIGDIFSLEERARYMGVFSTIWGVSALIGPAIGGFLTEQVSWRGVFYVNLPLCLITLALVGRYLHERVHRRPHSIDYLGALLLTVSVSALLFGLHAIESPQAAPLLALAALTLAAFVWWERRAAEPLVPLGLFSRRIIGVATAASFLAGVALHGQSAFVPPFLQGVMGSSPTVAGLVLAATSITWPLAATLSGRWVMRVGYRLPGVLGGVLMAGGFVLEALIRPDDGLLVPILVQLVIGAGFGLVFPTTLLAVQNAVAWNQRGVVTSAAQFARSIGGAVGVSVAGATFAYAVVAAAGQGVDPNLLLTPEGRASLPATDLSLLRESVAGALRTVFLLIAAASALALATLALLPGGHPSEHAWQASGSTARGETPPVAPAPAGHPTSVGRAG